MHVFLTGDVQIGKSTAIRRAIAQLGRPVYGFRTFFTDRESAEKSLYDAACRRGARAWAGGCGGRVQRRPSHPADSAL